jgi:hypothetical protein
VGSNRIDYERAHFDTYMSAVAESDGIPNGSAQFRSNSVAHASTDAPDYLDTFIRSDKIANVSADKAPDSDTELWSHVCLDRRANGSAYAIAVAIAFICADISTSSGANAQPNFCADSQPFA